MTFTNTNQFSNTILLNKPIAQKISWKPIQKNRTPLTHMTLESNENTLEFHLNVVSRLFYFSFIIFGIIFSFYATYELLSYNFQTTLWSVLLGFALIGVGLHMFSKQALPHIFNKDQNIYFKKNENLEREDETPLNSIHALQVISYTQKSSNKTKKQAELNLVLNNGKRIYVRSYDTNEYEHIKKDVEKISKYINKPIWNGEMS